MELFIQQAVNGLALGSTYAIFGIGFGLVFSTMGILNVAHGTFATWGAIVSLWFVTHWDIPFYLALLIGFLAGGIIGVIVDQLAFQPLRAKSRDLIPALITSIGALTILGSLARIATDAKTSRYPPGSYSDHLFHVGGIVIPWIQAVAIILLIVVVVVLDRIMRRTRLGKAMRAVGHDVNAAAISGVNPRNVVIATAFIAGAVAGLAGVLAGASTNNISFLLGEALLLKGFAAVVVGGFGDIRGTAIGGLLIGVCEVLAAQYIGGSWRDAITFGLLLIFLMYRPYGLFSGSTTVSARA